MNKEIRSAVNNVLETLNISVGDFSVEHPADVSYGDYSTNVAMVVAKSLGENPRELAEKINKKLLVDLFVQGFSMNIMGGYYAFTNEDLHSDERKLFLKEQKLGKLFHSLSLSHLFTLSLKPIFPNCPHTPLIP